MSSYSFLSMLAVVAEADQYIILVAITLLLTIMSIAWRESITLSMLATLSWIVSTLGSFSVGSQTSSLTTVLAYLSLAFALIFGVRTVIMGADWIGARKKKRFDVVFE